MESLESPIINKQKIYASKELIEDWKEWYLKEGHSIKSMVNYYNYIKLFVGEGIELKQKNIDSFREKHYNVVSSSALKKFCYFLVVKKKYPRSVLNFYYGKNKSTKKSPEGLQVIEITTLINAIKTPPYPIKVKLITLFTYELALRISESLKVSWNDFNWMTWLQNKEEYGTVNIKHTKRDKFRSIPVHPNIMKLLYDSHPLRNSFGVPIGGLVFDLGIEGFKNKEKTDDEVRYEYLTFAYNYYRYVITKIAKEVLNKKIHLHQLRHGKAQSLLDNGVSLDGLKLLLGHEKISTTEIYAQSSPTKLLNELKAIDKLKESYGNKNN